MKNVFFALVLTVFCLKINAQDKHFTQFYASPLTLNPALTGAIEGKYRVGLIYRDQWRQVLDEPMKTVGLGADLRLKPPFRSRSSNYKDQIGVGVHFFSDRVSVADFNTTQLALSMAYHKALDLASRQFLSVGIQYGLSQRTVNYENLDFHDEFDGLTGYTLGSNEVLPENTFSFNDFNVGLNYSGRYENDYGFFGGLAYHHFLKPNISFYGESGDGQTLLPKISGQFALSIPLNQRTSLLPRFLVAVQGPHLELTTGANLKTRFGEYGGHAIHVGAWARPVKNDGGFGLDAVVLMGGYELGNVVVGLSYDLNLRAISKFGQRQGAFELSFQYLGEYENEEVLCPKF